MKAVFAVVFILVGLWIIDFWTAVVTLIIFLAAGVLLGIMIRLEKRTPLATRALQRLAQRDKCSYQTYPLRDKVNARLLQENLPPL